LFSFFSFFLFLSLSSLLQQEIITNVGYDMPLIAKAVGGKGNGTVLKRRKSGASGSNKGQATYLNKGDDIGVDNHIVCNVRSMMGKLSKNIVVQLEAPIHVENKLTVPIYLRLTSNGAQYNDHHPSDETYGLPIIEGKALAVVQRETNHVLTIYFFKLFLFFFFILISSNNNFICFNNTWNTVFCVAMCQCECSFFFVPMNDAVQPDEIARCFANPDQPLIEMGIRNPYVPEVSVRYV
jgi:hypothetical protein